MIFAEGRACRVIIAEQHCPGEAGGGLPVWRRALLAGQCPSLAGHLARVPDPRDPRGVRHTLTSLLLAAVAAVLAGARSFTAIGEWAADAPPRVLAALGVRYDPLARRFQPPNEATFRRVLEAVDAAALEAAVGSWLAARVQAAWPRGPGRQERRAVAVDGKAVRGTRHTRGDGQARRLLAAADHQAGTVLAQAEVDGKTNEITAFAPLLEPVDLAGAVVTADALHAQREHAQFLVTAKNAHYILAVKNNTTVIGANVAYPTDTGLLARAVGKLVRAARRVRATGGAPGTVMTDRRRAAAGRYRQIVSALRTRDKLAGEESTRVIARLTGELAGLAASAAAQATAVLRNGRRAVPQALSGRVRGRLVRALDELAVAIERAAVVVAQARTRLAGQTPDGATRLVSLHDPDARPIRKGRIGRPVEFGYKAQVADNDDGVILDYSVEYGGVSGPPLPNRSQNRT
jgi:hypothetical protein